MYVENRAMALRHLFEATPAQAPERLPSHVRRETIRLRDGARTTLHVASYPLDRTSVRVVRLPRPTPLAAWCEATGTAEALVGGFFARPHGTPLGELRQAGVERQPRPVRRALVGSARLRARRRRRGADRAARPRSRPRPRATCCRRGRCWSIAAVWRAPATQRASAAGARQFDSDITDGRYPRAALAIARRGRLLAVACDGRADDEAGLTMGELAETLIALGALQALNLDGGGSTSLVAGGRLRNTPRESHGVELAGGRPISTAIAFTRSLTGTTPRCVLSARRCSSRAAGPRTSPVPSRASCPRRAGT